jgi:hypothetical protein
MCTVVLVGRSGSIDWHCYPHFDSQSIFGAIREVVAQEIPPWGTTTRSVRRLPHNRQRYSGIDVFTFWASAEHRSTECQIANEIVIIVPLNLVNWKPAKGSQ